MILQCFLANHREWEARPQHAVESGRSWWGHLPYLHFRETFPIIFPNFLNGSLSQSGGLWCVFLSLGTEAYDGAWRGMKLSTLQLWSRRTRRSLACVSGTAKWLACNAIFETKPVLTPIQKSQPSNLGWRLPKGACGKTRPWRKPSPNLPMTMHWATYLVSPSFNRPHSTPNPFSTTS